MDPQPLLKLSPERRLVMTAVLRQSLEILQMSQQELNQWLQNEIEKNPLLEFKFPSLGGKIEIDVPSTPTLYEHLQNQIRENFSMPEERLLAETLLEHLDERGFLSCQLEMVSKQPVESILSVLQTFDPPGIFARSLQETFLLQLKMKGKSDTIAFNLVQTCFDDLLHGRYTAIKKKLGTEDLGAAITDLSRLSFRPANAFRQVLPIPIHPDLRICKIEGGWTLELTESEWPQLQIRENYLASNPKSEEERESLRNFKVQAKWVCRSLDRRRRLLQEIGRILICKQAAYLNQTGPLNILTIRELAEKLEIHESTLSRALASKYVSTPRGIIPLRALISSAPATETAREILEKLIRGEDKQDPLTDDELAQELKAKGFPVARRTVAKYRSQLKIGSAAQRKYSEGRYTQVIKACL